MSPIFLWDGKILARDGLIAAHERCCCGVDVICCRIWRYVDYDCDPFNESLDTMSICLPCEDGTAYFEDIEIGCAIGSSGCINIDYPELPPPWDKQSYRYRVCDIVYGDPEYLQDICPEWCECEDDWV